MRHNKKINHLGRQAAHRKALLANLANSLIRHKRINTTVAKAKALRMYVEPLITKSKLDTTHSRRVVFSYLKDKQAVAELFREIAPKIADRPGGYCRILKTGFRLGDAAEMCFIELVDFNETYTKEAKVAEKPKTRRSRSGAKKAAEPVEAVAEPVLRKRSRKRLQRRPPQKSPLLKKRRKRLLPKKRLNKTLLHTKSGDSWNPRSCFMPVRLPKCGGIRAVRPDDVRGCRLLRAEYLTARFPEDAGPFVFTPPGMWITTWPRFRCAISRRRSWILWRGL